jgi:hypothetical protein
VSLIVRVPVRFAFAVGVKVTEIVQVNPEPNAPQVLDDIAKSVAFRPVMVMALIVTATASLFVSVTALGVLVVPTDWLPNASELGETDIELGAGVGIGVGVTVGVAVGVGVGVGVEVGTGNVSPVSAL